MSHDPHGHGTPKREDRDPRKHPAPGGYPPGQPTPDHTPPKAPGTGSPHEHQNDPDEKPGRGNG
jgi:hypothetical protein